MGTRWMGWWYLAIAVGFGILAIDHILVGDVPWLIGVRIILAFGFGFLSWMELRGRHKRR
ncbi:MAG: hypothetical protein M3Y24_12965 [Acidobacteriota bacterium]|nr:hypothetical protein [Acidobacteriota bacterium]